MSIFQCHYCGSAENTALTDMYHCIYMYNRDFDRLYNQKKLPPNDQRLFDALKSYKHALGMEETEDFQPACQGCSPIWFDSDGNYGVGEAPDNAVTRKSQDRRPKTWHGRFSRIYLPKGEWETNQEGNLVKIGETDKLGKYDTSKYALRVDVYKGGEFIRTITDKDEIIAYFSKR